jgi:hypothetical protein
VQAPKSQAAGTGKMAIFAVVCRGETGIWERTASWSS